MSNSLNLRFEALFKLTTMCMRLNGTHPDIKRDTFWRSQFSFLMIFATANFVLLCYAVFHSIVNGEFAQACKCGTMAIVYITITIKYFTLLLHQASIKELRNYIEMDYKQRHHLADEDQDIVVEYATKGVMVCKYWLVVAFGTAAIFPVKAFVLMTYYYWQGEFRLVELFEFTYPKLIEDRKDSPVVFCVLFVSTLLFASYAASVYIGFDPLVPILMLHVCGQLRLLNRRMGSVFEDFEDSKEIKKSLKEIIVKLQSLYRFMDCVQRNFSIIYEYIMKANTFLMPLTAFQIVEDLRNGWINFEFISFFIGCIIHFFIPCYYSTLLMETSDNFRQAIYSSGWEKYPDKEARQIILLMLTRSITPIGIKTVFYEVNLDAFAEMCRQSYALFNLMNAAWS